MQISFIKKKKKKKIKGILKINLVTFKEVRLESSSGKCCLRKTRRSGPFPLHFPPHPQSPHWGCCYVHLHTFFLASLTHLLPINPFLIPLIHLTPQAPVAASSVLRFKTISD